ncbi:NADH:ubiquinone reductase (Na(+)-transporting) subunit B [Flammeovirga yaeyamensis]|uniref:Na(+)-translocating NADH-quinone reductase subunit B n=1 Tax=Flammeovirga yaeyamensis TaxID=367791 RepID=A0AAX1N872_9BACT|nr:NADH:ubiquinone reductase (Na(+)-transporting) subunit B [Flammeovirga yaeyamensis]MBB3698031.1 Na+-transporting NADH:ubiquinone oxidoreductase subunit B [Flammeovirga yaeyamensis]NMF35617.1 NADH:ubiquinone reductase (Na(+)-transporting) subunit B [Flammeovirga yaeyamensis]QWG03426.1 NADH:ubiquinone reductase (Na(+)-transporting) subunit B [Flammeovirga yaeyamensis]
MKFLHDLLEKQKPLFEKGGKLEKLYYVFEAGETFMFTPPEVTKAKGVQVRDAVDLKRVMMTVVIALIPAILFGIWNVGYQHFLATNDAEVASFGAQLIYGLKLALPLIIVSYAAGGTIEAAFAVFRNHPITEGFLVTGILIPLVVPASLPLWQIALASAFAVLIAKEVFGGVGMNILNVALTARAFLYFAYPAQISGDKVWIEIGETAAGQAMATVDGFTGATFLGLAVEAQKVGQPVADFVAQHAHWVQSPAELAMTSFIGLIPGSIGETSALMCLIGAIVLIWTKVADYRIILSGVLGALGMGVLLNVFAGDMQAVKDGVEGAKYFAYLDMPSYYHLIVGGFAFGIVFMATDPVSASQTNTGKWIYGAFIGIMTVIIRVLNPAYPEGIMLAILLMNVMAPLIDNYVVNANKKRRLKRATV